MFLQDLRYGLRRLAKSPGFTVVAILTLALGIGANTAIFSVVNGVLISPLPFRNANRILSVFQDLPDFPEGSISYPDFLAWQTDNHSFESMAAYRWADGTITGVSQPETSQHGLFPRPFSRSWVLIRFSDGISTPRTTAVVQPPPS